jgi:hypothetical protein
MAELKEEAPPPYRPSEEMQGAVALVCFGEQTGLFIKNQAGALRRAICFGNALPTDFAFARNEPLAAYATEFFERAKAGYQGQGGPSATAATQASAEEAAPVAMTPRMKGGMVLICFAETMGILNREQAGQLLLALALGNGLPATQATIDAIVDNPDYKNDALEFLLRVERARKAGARVVDVTDTGDTVKK